MTAVFRVGMTLATAFLLLLTAYLAAVLALGAFVILSVMAIARRFGGWHGPAPSSYRRAAATTPHWNGDRSGSICNEY